MDSSDIKSALDDNSLQETEEISQSASNSRDISSNNILYDGNVENLSALLRTNLTALNLALYEIESSADRDVTRNLLRVEFIIYFILPF